MQFITKNCIFEAQYHSSQVEIAKVISLIEQFEDRKENCAFTKEVKEHKIIFEVVGDGNKKIFEGFLEKLGLKLKLEWRTKGWKFQRLETLNFGVVDNINSTIIACAFFSNPHIKKKSITNRVESFLDLVLSKACRETILKYDVVSLPKGVYFKLYFWRYKHLNEAKIELIDPKNKKMINLKNFRIIERITPRSLKENAILTKKGQTFSGNYTSCVYICFKAANLLNNSKRVEITKKKVEQVILDGINDNETGVTTTVEDVYKSSKTKYSSTFQGSILCGIGKDLPKIPCYLRSYAEEKRCKKVFIVIVLCNYSFMIGYNQGEKYFPFVFFNSHEKKEFENKAGFFFLRNKNELRDLMELTFNPIEVKGNTQFESIVLRKKEGK